MTGCSPCKISLCVPKTSCDADFGFRSPQFPVPPPELPAPLKYFLVLWCREFRCKPLNLLTCQRLRSPPSERIRQNSLFFSLLAEKSRPETGSHVTACATTQSGPTRECNRLRISANALVGDARFLVRMLRDRIGAQTIDRDSAISVVFAGPDEFVFYVTILLVAAYQAEFMFEVAVFRENNPYFREGKIYPTDLLQNSIVRSYASFPTDKVAAMFNTGLARGLLRVAKIYLITLSLQHSASR